MNELTQLSFDALLDRVAERTPTPGGGAVAAAAGALACAMGEMVAAFSVNSKTAEPARARVEQLRQRLHRASLMLREFMVEDAAAYEELTEANKALRDAQKTGAELPTVAAATEVRRLALAAALTVPMEMAAVLTEMLETLDGSKDAASRFLLSDLAVAAVLAEAAARSALYIVLVNAGDIADAVSREQVRNTAEGIVARCSRHRTSIEAFLSQQLNGAGA